MADEPVSTNEGQAQAAVRALYDYLRTYFLQHRIPWMHDLLGDDFARGHASAVTGLVLLPGLRAALDSIEAEEGGHVMGSLESFHPQFTPEAEDPS
jgi:hypothetical protein